MFLKARLSGEEVLRGIINLIPSAVVTQAAAAAGADFVVIDGEHGPIGREGMHAMIASTAGTACAPLVRVPSIDAAEVKLALDAGAEGIVYPMLRTVEDAERCVSYMSYPPNGVRGWGPFVAHSRFGGLLGEYSREVAPHLTCCLLIETVEAVENIERILQVPGIDLAVVAQFDLSTALGAEGDFNSPAFVAALETIEHAVFASGVPIGGAALTAEQSASLIAKGYRVLIHGFDVLMLKQQITAFKTWG